VCKYILNQAKHHKKVTFAKVNKVDGVFSGTVANKNLIHLSNQPDRGQHQPYYLIQENDQNKNKPISLNQGEFESV